MNKRGFTLVELLVVMAIIAILAIAGFSSYEGTKKSARDGRRKTDLENIRGAFELYFADEKAYPDSSTYDGWACGADITNGSSTYLKMPCDPLNDTKYPYSPTGSGYSIEVELERESQELTCASDTTVPTLRYCVTNP